jgi:hypothetical protein
VSPPSLSIIDRRLNSDEYHNQDVTRLKAVMLEMRFTSHKGSYMHPLHIRQATPIQLTLRTDRAKDQLREVGLTVFERMIPAAFHLPKVLMEHEEILAATTGHSNNHGPMLLVATNRRLLYIGNSASHKNAIQIAYNTLGAIDLRDTKLTIVTPATPIIIYTRNSRATELFVETVSHFTLQPQFS